MQSAGVRGHRSAAVYNVRKLMPTAGMLEDAVRPGGRVNGELQLRSERPFPP